MVVTGKSIAERSRAERQARLDLAAAYRIADLFGFSDVIWNHITAKVPGSERFLINRFGLRYDEVTASNLVTIDLDGNVIDPGNAVNGLEPEIVNRTGFVIHGAVHRARPDVHCVMHAHSAAGMAVSALQNGLEPMIIDAMAFHGRVAYHDFEGLSVDTAECARLAANLGERNVMILRNYGLLTCGESVGAAFMRMYYLERACDVQLRVSASGLPVSRPSADVMEKTAAQLAGYAPGDCEWPALVRLADARCPGYRD